VASYRIDYLFVDICFSNPGFALCNTSNGFTLFCGYRADFIHSFSIVREARCGCVIVWLCGQTNVGENRIDSQKQRTFFSILIFCSVCVFLLWVATSGNVGEIGRSFRNVDQK